MFIIWGSKKVQRKLGFVAEACPRCLGVRSVKVSRLGMASHVYYLPLGRGQMLGFAGECQACSGVFDVQPMDYASFEKSKKASLEQLIGTTNPKLHPDNEPAMASFKRMVALRDPLLRVNKVLDERYGQGTALDLRSGLAFLATFAVPIAIGVCKSSLPVSDGMKALIGDFALTLFVVGLIASFVLLYRAPKRFFTTQLLPEIVRELRPLHPRHDELQSCLSSLKKYGYRITGFVKAESLVASVQGSTGTLQPSAELGYLDKK